MSDLIRRKDVLETLRENLIEMVGVVYLIISFSKVKGTPKSAPLERIVSFG